MAIFLYAPSLNPTECKFFLEKSWFFNELIIFMSLDFFITGIHALYVEQLGLEKWIEKVELGVLNYPHKPFSGFVDKILCKLKWIELLLQPNQLLINEFLRFQEQFFYGAIFFLFYWYLYQTNVHLYILDFVYWILVCYKVQIRRVIIDLKLTVHEFQFIIDPGYFS